MHFGTSPERARRCAGFIGDALSQTKAKGARSTPYGRNLHACHVPPARAALADQPGARSVPQTMHTGPIDPRRMTNPFDRLIYARNRHRLSRSADPEQTRNPRATPQVTIDADLCGGPKTDEPIPSALANDP